MRASAAIENAGIPTVSLVCDGFLDQAKAVSPGLGAAFLPTARLVGHVDGVSVELLASQLKEVTLQEVLNGLCMLSTAIEQPAEPIPDKIVTRGSFDEINDYFYLQGWSDGLSIVPPTPERVSAFLAKTDDTPNHLIGVIQPSGSAATILNVAVNGVMANCKPEYMPVLVAIAEVLADSNYGVEHSGDTTGGEALIMLNGPVVKYLDFNCETAALRDGQRANTSIGRFLRLYLRNVVGFRPGAADKATFGNTWRVVLAENETACASMNWQPFSCDQGFEKGCNVVTLARFTAGGVVGSVYGNDPEQLIAYLADGLVRQSSWELVFTVGFAPTTYRPLLVISPMILKTLTNAGWSKTAVRNRLFELARVPAKKFENYIGTWTNLVPGRPTLDDLVTAGSASTQFSHSKDPERLVPIVEKAEHIMLIVSGDPLRSNAYVFASNGMHGFPTSKRIRFTDKGARNIDSL